MNVNELKAYIEGLLAAESEAVPRDAVVRIKEMVEKLPPPPSVTVSGPVPASSHWVIDKAGSGGTGWVNGKLWTSGHPPKFDQPTNDGAGGG